MSFAVSSLIVTNFSHFSACLIAILKIIGIDSLIIYFCGLDEVF